MELDLDDFLQSHGTSDEDDDNQHHLSIPHRTVDEILLNDSSSSDSDSPSPSSFNRSYRPRFSSDLTVSDDTKPQQDTSGHRGNDDVSVSTSKISALDEALNSREIPKLSSSQLDDKPLHSNFSSSSRLRSLGEVSGDSFLLGRNVLSPLPPLFGGVRSNANAKPGAALAAAVAASRSVPSPHAAAIKSRRASSATSEQLLETVELGSKASSSSAGGDSESVSESGGDFERLGPLSDEVPNRASSEDSQSDGKLLLVEEDVRSWDDFKSAIIEVDAVGEFSGGDRIGEGSLEAGEVLPSEEIPTQVAHISDIADKLGVDDNLEDISSSSNAKPHVSSGPDIEEDENLDGKDKQSLGYEKNGVSSAFTDDIESTEGKGNALSPVSDEGKKIEENLTYAVLETHDQENVIPHFKDREPNIAGDYNSSTSDAADLVEDIITQWENMNVSKRTGKKSRSSMKPLELAEELEKKQAFTGLHWEEGVAAQPMRLEGVRRESTVLGYFDVDTNNTITRTISSQAFRQEHGSPQSMAVHLNFIAVGMSRGLIFVQPSKYSPHRADNMDAKMLVLGSQGDRTYVPVTSMCFNHLGDLLFAGYGDGHITVWEVQKASAAKVISEHKAPVVHLLYLGQEDSQVSRQHNVVSGDSKGLIWLINLTVFTWLNRYSYKTTLLLDQSTSTVVCASPLLSDDCRGGSVISSQGSATVSSGSIGSMRGGVVGGDAGRKLFEGSSLVEGVVIFVTHQSALVAKVHSQKVDIYARLSRPDGVREGSMPYTAWKSNVPVEASEKVSLLAVAWDRKVQVAKLVKSELKIYGQWTLDSSAIGVAWLDDQMLLVLTSSGQLSLFAKDGTLIHQTSFAVDGSRGDDLIAYHTHFSNIFGNPEKAYHNCVSVRGATVYMLGPMHLVVSRLLPWKERIEVLRKAGDWMGALNMAMTLYDGQAHGVIDLPRSLDDLQRAIMSYLVELLLSYVDEVFSYISVAFCNQIGKLDQSDDSKNRNSSAHSEIKEHFTLVGGVAVEFCVHIKRTDILFDEIFSKFVSAQQRETFLELLEPYILKDMLGSLPPEIMQALVEHYSIKGWLQRVEQCVLHMDISSLDFNQVVRLCREHRLYGALIYLFNKGLDDFRAPLEELLVVLRNSEIESAPALGYRMLVYLKYCFSGLAFPAGHGTLPPTRLPSLRKELIQFLLEDSSPPNSLAVTSLSYPGAYLNLYHLLELDTEATLDVLRIAFVEDEIPKPDYPLHDSADSNLEAMKENKSIAGSQDLVQKTVNALAFILDTGHFQDKSINRNDGRSTETWPSKKDLGYVFEFIAYYVACGRANVPKGIISQILDYLTSDINLPPNALKQNIESLKRREKQVLALLEVVPETDWDTSYLLHLCEKAQFYQVCGHIHAIRHQYLAALDSYMKDVYEPIHAFSFINDMLLRLSDKESDAFQSAVMSRIPDLVKLSREGIFFLVVDHLSRESERILSELRSYPESLFLYLKTVIEVHSTGTLNFSSLIESDDVNFPIRGKARDWSDKVVAFLERIADFPKFLLNNPVHVTDEMIELYLELLCRYERNSVLKFLETFESYRVEHCLRLCQEYEIIDAAAFLLERVGDVGSALVLTLSGLDDKFILLDAAVGNVLSDADVDIFNAVLKKREVNDILNIVHACIGLCQRNTPRVDPDESESHWFRLLDSFCEPLMDSFDTKMKSEGEKHMGILADSLCRQEDEETCRIKWKVSRSHKGAYILRKLLSMFIKEIVEGMIGYVQLPTIMLKLLSDNGSQEFGDFKITILGMLGTYDFERRILDTAKSLIEDDTFYTMSLLKKGASQGYAPRSLICCICNCQLTKNSSSSSSIHIFSCGHATHLQCELQENEEPYRGSSAGCPICMPKKKAQRSKNKSVLVENGLVSKSSSKRSQLAQGTISLHPYESDPFENSYGLHPITRFEILNNLQKDHRFIQVENVPQLRLAPPAIYHEKVKKGIDLLTGESSSSGLPKIEKASKKRQLREVKAKGSAIRFPMKANIFGKEKTNKR